jgi:hypothetical protein
MYLIDKTYFNGILNVPNIYEVNSDELQNLNKNIDKYARLFMQEFLGVELFIEFDSHLTGGVLNSNAPQKWKDIVNGVVYTLNGKTFKWKGLIYSEGAINISLLANFVYYYSFQTCVNSSIGQVVINPRNATNVNPSEHLTQVWNEFVSMYQSYDTPNALQYYHNNTMFVDHYNSNTSGFVSLLQFVTDKKSDYETIVAPCLNFKNRFGL